MLFFLLSIFGSSLALIMVLEKFASRFNLIDHPIARSAHKSPTPSGGGLVVAVLFVFAAYLLNLNEYITNDVFYALLGAVPVAAVGLFDDLSHVSLRFRLPIQFFAACWSIYYLGGVPPIDFPLLQLSGSLILTFLGILALVWLLNLYNFMDGIDAIAATEVLFVSLMTSFFGVYDGDETLALMSATFFAANAGFLVWNWPPAKLFMGDVGSGFIGFILGIFALFSMHNGTMTVWTWFILLGVFVVDSTVTLLVRFMSGEKWYEGHSCHAYQNAARKWRSHQRVVISILLINLTWLAPLSWLSFLYPEIGFYICLVALAPLVYLCNKFKAGIHD